ASAHVDDVGTLVGGVHDSTDDAAGRVRVGGVRDLHCEERDVPVHARQNARVARDGGRHGGAVPEQVTEREPARIVARHVLGYEGYRAVEIHEPREIRVRIVDAGVEDRDHNVA